MPYISQTDRKLMDNQINQLIIHTVNHPGFYNYAITRLIHNYIISNGESYKTINDAIGILECAKLELYRMVAAPYEDQKRKDNGCVGELDK